MTRFLLFFQEYIFVNLEASFLLDTTRLWMDTDLVCGSAGWFSGWSPGRLCRSGGSDPGIGWPAHCSPPRYPTDARGLHVIRHIREEETNSSVRKLWSMKLLIYYSSRRAEVTVWRLSCELITPHKHNTYQTGEWWIKYPPRSTQTGSNAGQQRCWHASGEMGYLRGCV